MTGSMPSEFIGGGATHNSTFGFNPVIALRTASATPAMQLGDLVRAAV
ncbi:hypothetical protein [Sinisalibacter lacisalsi]|nr:hypothetical protein [Sinisalibacter lacisalsi]